MVDIRVVSKHFEFLSFSLSGLILSVCM